MRPKQIETAFRAAFAQLGGRMVAREPGCFEVTQVPEQLRAGRNGLVAARYPRVTFDPARGRPQQGIPPDLIDPGHPLLDATMHCQ